MSRQPGPDDRDFDLPAAVEAYCNGNMGAEELARLEAILLADPAARARFLEYMNVDAALHAYSAPLDAPAPADERPGALRRRARVLAVVAAVAALSALGTWVAVGPGGRGPGQKDPSSGRPNGETDIAVVLAAEKVEWADGSSAFLDAHDLAPTGRLALSAGRLSLALFNGVVVHLEGPVDLDLVQLDRLVCRRGRFRVKVPPKAAGFTIECPGCAVVDQGGEFALNVDPDGRTRVLVYAGAVEVSARDAAGRVRQLEQVGQARSVEHVPGSDRVTEIALNRSEFITDLPVAPAAAGPLLRLHPSYPSEIRAARPKHYWRFERADGDRVVNDMDGPALLRGRAVQARREAHDNHSVAFAPGDPSQFLAVDDLWRPPATGYAIEFWFAPDAIAQSALVSVLGELPNGRGEANTLYLETAPGERPGPRPLTDEFISPPQVLRLMHRWPPGRDGGSGMWSSRVYREARWHHVTVQRRGDRIELYLNGERVGDAALAPGFGTGPSRVVFGRRYYAAKVPDAEQRPFAGKLDEVALYDRPLAPDEIRKHYELGAGKRR